MAGRRLSVDIERRHRGGPTIRATFELDLDAGEVLALFGPSGSGKTTVLRCVAGLEHPQAGTIVADGRTWFDADGGVAFPRRPGASATCPRAMPCSRTSRCATTSARMSGIVSRSGTGG